MLGKFGLIELDRVYVFVFVVCDFDCLLICGLKFFLKRYWLCGCGYEFYIIIYRLKICLSEWNMYNL